MQGKKPSTASLDALLAECAVDHFSGTGKGGRNRNRHYHCVRLRHRPTGLIAVGTEHRSLARNRELALARLAEKLAARSYKPPPRKPTRVPSAARAQRLDTKARTGRKKAVRKKISDRDGAD